MEANKKEHVGAGDMAQSSVCHTMRSSVWTSNTYVKRLGVVVFACNPPLEKEGSERPMEFTGQLVSLIE